MSFTPPYYGYPNQPINMNYGTYTPVQQYMPQQFVQTQPINQQINQPVNQQQQVYQTQDNTIACEYVDNLEVVNAKNCDFTGKPVLYMKTDGSEIYRKQLDIKTGRSTTYVYKIQSDSNEISNEKSQNSSLNFNEINSQIESLRNEFTQNLMDLKVMVMNLNNSNTTKSNNSSNSTKRN